MTIKRVGVLWYVMQDGKVLKVCHRFKEAAQWMKEQTQPKQHAA
jgi:ribosomal protein L24E